MDSLSLLQGIFPTQGSNPGLPHFRQILYQLSYKGSLILEWVAYPFSSGSSGSRNQPGSPALQVDSLPTEPPGKPAKVNQFTSVQSLSLVRLFVTPWTVDCQALLSMGFSRQEYWSVFSSVQFSRSVVSDSLRPHESQHARPPCPSPTPRVHSNSHPSSQ